MAFYDVYGNKIENEQNGIKAIDSVVAQFPELLDSYVFTSEKSEDRNSVKLLDFGTGDVKLQSVGYDYENGAFYKFADEARALKFNMNRELVGTISLPSPPGHANDTCYHKGKFYFACGSTGDADGYAERIYSWDIKSNSVSYVSVDGIKNPSNGSKRRLGAICEADRGSGKFYLVCRDIYESDITHQDGDKMSVYLYDLATNAATLVAEYDWDCVYVQGCTCVNGFLYVACNTGTTGSASNYKGITIKVIDTLGWDMIDELTTEGVFEPEGMDFIQQGSGNYLTMGVARYGSFAICVLLRAPY